MLRPLALTSMLLLGCGTSSSPVVDTSSHAPLLDGSFGPLPDAPSCAAVVEAHAFEGNAHVAPCLPVAYASNPPSTGNHYSIWAAFGIYETPVPRGFWVHDLEHGAVVITYNCSDCSSELQAARAFIDVLPVDPACAGANGGAGPKRRILLTPDPLLDVRFAASAWQGPAYDNGGPGTGYTLRAPCFDAVAFAAFVTAHYARGPEDLCYDG